MTMEWIPAIDIKNGLPVHATGKDRSHYHPVNTALFPKLDLYSTVCTLIYYHSFTNLYLADLDALTGTGDNTALIQSLVKQFAEITFWIDTGLCDRIDYQTLYQWGNNVVPIIATETFMDIQFLKKLHPRDYVLSLDFKNHTLLGNQILLTEHSLWSERVLLLSLDAIHQGRPDFEILDQVLTQVHKQTMRQKSICSHLILGGGIRNTNDIALLQKKGLTGVLLATALYEGKLFSKTTVPASA